MVRDGYPYIVHPLMDGVPRVDPRLLEAWTDWAEATGLARDATLLVAPEAMALPLAAALALRTRVPYVVVRKRAYDLPGEETAVARTGYGGATLHLNDVAADDRVLVVDDVLSTGGTLGSVLEAIRRRGAGVLGALVFLDKGDAAAALRERFAVPVQAMRRVAVDGGRVRVVPSADAGP